MKFNYLEFSSPFFCYFTTKKLFYTQKKNSTISNTTINIHLATTVVELLMEIKFSYTFFGVREKRKNRKWIKVKPVTRRERRKMMGKIIWMLRKGDFCVCFFMFVIYIFCCATRTQHWICIFSNISGVGHEAKKALAPNNLSISITIYI